MDKNIELKPKDIYRKTKKKPIHKRGWFLVMILIVGFGMIGVDSQGNDQEVSLSSNENISETTTLKGTSSQQNAVRDAIRYLENSAFSKRGLIGQLEYEGYSTADATYGANNSGANWNEQAEKSAKSYLENSAFSRAGLIDQLEYEGFTTAQATHGVNFVGLGGGSLSASSNEETGMKGTVSQQNAVRAAISYLEYGAFSKQGLIDQLEYEGYSNADATYGASNCDADWDEQAEKCAENYLKYSAFSKQGLIEQLEYEGFTHSQAVHGVISTGL